MKFNELYSSRSPVSVSVTLVTREMVKIVNHLTHVMVTTVTLMHNVYQTSTMDTNVDANWDFREMVNHVKKTTLVMNVIQMLFVITTQKFANVKMDSSVMGKSSLMNNK